MGAKREELGGRPAAIGASVSAAGSSAAAGRPAAVKGTMLQAHVSWAHEQIRDLERLKPHLDAGCAALMARRIFPTEWVPFRCLIQIDRAIATVLGGTPERVFQDLGRHSATTNLSGVYKTFISDEPHHFFNQMSVLHGQFQNFGHWRYERLTDRSGRITLDGYSVYSPVYCSSALGYFEQALRMMHAPGPIIIRETSCQCDGQPQCVYEMGW